MAKVKIPKRVAGMKIPKKVRKRAKKALKLAESPELRKVAISAIGAAASAKAFGDEARAAIRAQGERTEPGGRIDVDTLKDALRTAALDGIRRFMEGFDEEMRKASAAVSETADAAAKAANDTADKPPRRGNGKKPSRPGAGAAAE